MKLVFVVERIQCATSGKILQFVPPQVPVLCASSLECPSNMACLPRGYNGFGASLLSSCAHSGNPAEEQFLASCFSSVQSHSERSHIDWLHLQSMALGILNKDTGGIKAHRLCIQKPGRERRQIMTFQIAAGVGNQTKTVSMRFGKGIAKKALDAMDNFVLRFRINFVLGTCLRALA